MVKCVDGFSPWCRRCRLKLEIWDDVFHYFTGIGEWILWLYLLGITWHKCLKNRTSFKWNDKGQPQRPQPHIVEPITQRNKLSWQTSPDLKHEGLEMPAGIESLQVMRPRPDTGIQLNVDGRLDRQCHRCRCHQSRTWRALKKVELTLTDQHGTLCLHTAISC